MSSRRTGAILAVAIAATTVLAGCDGQTPSDNTSPATTPPAKASSTPKGNTPTDGSATTSTPMTGSPKPGTITKSPTNPTAPKNPATSKTSASPKTSIGGHEPTSAQQTMTLKVGGNAELKVTKITVKGAVNTSKHAPTTLSVAINSRIKIGYTITAVALSGKITSCVAVLPSGTKHITPQHGACSVTYTPGS